MFTERSKYKYTVKLLNDYRTTNIEDLNVHHVMWAFLSCQWRYKLPEDFIIKFRERLQFWELSKRKNYSKEILNCPELKSYWRWDILIEFSDTITDEMVDYFLLDPKQYYQYPYICRNLNYKMSLGRVEKLLDTNHTVLQWNYLSERKDLTKEFVEKYLTDFNLGLLLEDSNFKKLYRKDKDFIHKIKMLHELRGYS